MRKELPEAGPVAFSRKMRRAVAAAAPLASAPLAIALLGMTVLTSLGCSQVPKQSVVLSATVGRDLSIVHAAHRQTVRVLFNRMRADVNRFVDEEYAPFMIRFVMDEQRRLALSKKPEEQAASVLLAIRAAFEEGAPPELQPTVVAAMQTLVARVHADVEDMRQGMLSPLEAQEGEVVAAVDVAYQRIEYANAVVTGHLASVVEVHETQAELLADVGVSRDVRGDLGRILADASEGIARIVTKVEDESGKVLDVIDKANRLKAEIGAIGRRISPPEPAKE